MEQVSYNEKGMKNGVSCLWRKILSGRNRSRDDDPVRSRSRRLCRGYVAATAGGQAGATIGTLLCPGVGTLIGGALGILVGAAGGAVAGNTVGKLIDENVIRGYRCGSCSYQWRV